MPANTGEELADRIVAATLLVPGVVRMHTGTFGQVGTYLPGRRVDGVSVREGQCEVHVVLRPDVDLLATAQTVRTAVRAVLDQPQQPGQPGQPGAGIVNVYVEDLAADPGARPATAGSTADSTAGSTDVVPSSGTQDADRVRPSADRP